jgi:two-component system response regulator HydG
VLSRDDVLDLDDFPTHISSLLQNPRAVTPVLEGRGVYLPIGLSLDEAERLLLVETLKATGGDKSLAAKILGVATRTVYRKLNAMEDE